MINNYADDTKIISDKSPRPDWIYLRMLWEVGEEIAGALESLVHESLVQVWCQRRAANIVSLFKKGSNKSLGIID